MGARDLMADAKVFGYLYAVTFETGAIKVGMSRSSPKSRIQSHTSAGAQFGVSVFNVQVVNVYTPDVAERETRLCAQLQQSAATQTAGREWFKFECKDDAVLFAKSAMSQIEDESFAARPSAEQIAIDLAKRDGAAQLILDRISASPAHRAIGEPRLCAIREFLKAMNMPLGGSEEAATVDLFYRLELVIADCGDDISKLPESADSLYYGDIDYEMAFCAGNASFRVSACRSILMFLQDHELHASLNAKYWGRT
jgi:hypothetical protein